MIPSGGRRLFDGNHGFDIIFPEDFFNFCHDNFFNFAFHIHKIGREPGHQPALFLPQQLLRIGNFDLNHKRLRSGGQGDGLI